MEISTKFDIGDVVLFHPFQLSKNPIKRGEIKNIKIYYVQKWIIVYNIMDLLTHVEWSVKEEDIIEKENQNE